MLTFSIFFFSSSHAANFFFFLSWPHASLVGSQIVPAIDATDPESGK
jgi:hypothetical protein